MKIKSKIIFTVLSLLLAHHFQQFWYCLKQKPQKINKTMTESNLRNPLSRWNQNRNETNSMPCIPDIGSNFSLTADRISEFHIWTSKLVNDINKLSQTAQGPLFLLWFIRCRIFSCDPSFYFATFKHNLAIEFSSPVILPLRRYVSHHHI